MSGPIVRTGTNPKFWANWDNVFGDKKAAKADPKEAANQKADTKKSESKADAKSKSASKKAEPAKADAKKATPKSPKK